MTIMQITEDPIVTSTILKEIGIWALLGYMVIKDLYKDVKTWLMKKAEAGKKTAEIIVQEQIKTTLVNVEGYLRILVDNSRREVTKDQAEMIIRITCENKGYKIMEYLALMIKENNITYIDKALNDKIQGHFENLFKRF